MAIEIPNAFQAAGNFNGVAAPVGNPILSSNGFQPWNPNTNGADPAQVLGGFTRRGAGHYQLKTIDGCGPMDVVVAIHPASAPVTGAGNALGLNPAFPGTVGDGYTINLNTVNIQAAAIDASFRATVFRYQTAE